MNSRIPAYTSAEHLRGVFARLGRTMPAPVRDAEAFSAWQTGARRKLHALLSLDKLETCAPLAHAYEAMRIDGGYVRERAILQTEPEEWMPFFLLYKEGRRNGPAVLLPPVDGAGKFGMVWSDDYTALRDDLAPQARTALLARWAFAFRLADAGYLVAAPDFAGTGERREWMDWGEENFLRSSRRAINNAALGLGLSLAGLNVWSCMRLLDYLLTRPDFDGRLAVGGGGDAASQALYFAAADPRVAGAFISGWFAGFAGGMMVHGMACADAYVPSLWRFFDCCDIAALVAPRPLRVETGRHDPLSGPAGLANVMPQAEAVRNAYAQAGGEPAFTHTVVEGASPMPGENVLAFLGGAFVQERG